MKTKPSYNILVKLMAIAIIISFALAGPAEYASNLACTYRYPEWSAVYAIEIPRISDKYNLNPEIITRLIAQESGFEPWAISLKGALGPMQVKPIFWQHLLWRIDEPKLQKALKDTNRGPRQYLLRIPYGIEVGCMVMRYLLDKYGTIELCLVAYAYGESTDYFRRCLRRPELCYESEYVRKTIKGLGDE